MTNDCCLTKVLEIALAEGRDFVECPATTTIHDGKLYRVRTCYEYLAGKWEGFVSMVRVDR